MYIFKNIFKENGPVYDSPKLKIINLSNQRISHIKMQGFLNT